MVMYDSIHFEILGYFELFRLTRHPCAEGKVFYATEYEDGGDSRMISPAMVEKLKVWRARYLPAELYSLVVTMIVAVYTFSSTGSHLITALTATWAGSGVYFLYILVVDMRFARQQRHEHGKKYCFQTFVQNVEALVVEFGIAELADLLIIRPAMMFYVPVWMDDLIVGTLIAKLAADMTFYVPAIIGYEISQRWLRKFH